MMNRNKTPLTRRFPTALIASALLASAATAQPFPGPGEEVHWTIDMSPISLSTSRTIVADGTVIVDPGVTVNIARDVTLTVNGTLRADGNQSTPIQLRGVATFPPAIDVNGVMATTYTNLYGQIRGEAGGVLRFADSTFNSPGGLFEFGSSADLSMCLINLERCNFNSAAIDLARSSLLANDVVVDQSYIRASALLRLDNVTVQNSNQSGFILGAGIQPAYLNNVHALNNAHAGFELFGGGNFYFGTNNTISGNNYPVSMAGTAGFVPGSILPTTGNANNVVLGPPEGDARFGRSIWPEMPIPIFLEGAVTWFGSLDIQPGANITFSPRANLIFPGASHFIRGLPDKPIRFEPSLPGAQWFAVGFTGANSGMEYCYVDGGGVTSAVTPASHMENCILTNSSNGLSPGDHSNWFVGGTQFIQNPIAARTTTAGFASAGLHLENANNPNSFSGNDIAIYDESPNGATMVNARQCWWGDPSGPQHPQNPDGQGDRLVSSFGGTPKVDFAQWKTSEPSYDNHPPVVRLEAPYFVTNPGDKILLKWDIFDDDQVQEIQILFSAEGSFEFETLVDTLPGDASGYEWTIPDVGFLFNAPSFIRVVAIDSGGREGWDQSIAVIHSGEITSSINFTSVPDVVEARRAYEACWEIVNPNSDYIQGDAYLVLDADESSDRVGSFSNCTFRAKAPVVSTDLARLAVPLRGNCCNRIEYFFSPYFSIRLDPRIGDEPPQIAMTSPTQGEQYRGGAVIPVNWNASDDEALTSFKIQASYDAGRTWQTIARDIDPNARSYNWQLPTSAGVTDVRARVIAFDKHFQNSSNGTNRSFEILPGTECAADFNNDGTVNTLDFLDFLNAYNAGDPAADFNADGIINTLDFLDFLNAFNSGCE